MKQVMEEYGGALLAVVAAMGVIALVMGLLFAPGSVLSRGMEHMTDRYLTDRLEDSTRVVAEITEAEPLEICVRGHLDVGKTTPLTEIFCQKDGAALQQVRLLSEPCEGWKLTEEGMTFFKSGSYLVRVYGENREGDFGCCSLWLCAGKGAV